MIPKPIYLHITSYGEDCYAGRLAMDYIINSSIPIYTIGEGYIMSAASLMFIVGKKRFMTEQTIFMTHQLRGIVEGTFDHLCDDVKNSKILMDQAVRIYKQYSNMSEKDIREQLKKEEQFDFKICKKKGIVDDCYKMNEEELERKYFEKS